MPKQKICWRNDVDLGTVEEKFNLMKKLFPQQLVLLYSNTKEFSLTQMQEKQFLIWASILVYCCFIFSSGGFGETWQQEKPWHLRGIFQTKCKENFSAIEPKGEKLSFNIYVKVVRSGRVNAMHGQAICLTQHSSVTYNSVTQVGFNSRYWLHCHSNSKVSRTKIENLKSQISGDIIPLTFGKFVTS